MLYFQNQTRINLECMLRWIHIIDGEPCPLLAKYTFWTSMHVSYKVKIVYSYLHLITIWCTYNHPSIKLHPRALYTSMFCVYVSNLYQKHAYKVQTYIPRKTKFQTTHLWWMEQDTISKHIYSGLNPSTPAILWEEKYGI